MAVLYVDSVLEGEGLPDLSCAVAAHVGDTGKRWSIRKVTVELLKSRARSFMATFRCGIGSQCKGCVDVILMQKLQPPIRAYPIM